MKCFLVSAETQKRLRTYSGLRNHCVQFQIMESCAVRKMTSIIKKFGDWRATDPPKIGVWCGHHAKTLTYSAKTLSGRLIDPLLEACFASPCGALFRCCNIETQHRVPKTTVKSR